MPAQIENEVVDQVPTNETVQGAMNVQFSGKIYNSHTFYNKHIPYYAGLSNDAGPTMESVTEF